MESHPDISVAVTDASFVAEFPSETSASHLGSTPVDVSAEAPPPSSQPAVATEEHEITMTSTDTPAEPSIRADVPLDHVETEARSSESEFEAINLNSGAPASFDFIHDGKSVHVDEAFIISILKTRGDAERRARAQAEALMAIKDRVERLERENADLHRMLDEQTDKALDVLASSKAQAAKYEEAARQLTQDRERDRGELQSTRQMLGAAEAEVVSMKERLRKYLAEEYEECVKEDETNGISPTASGQNNEAQSAGTAFQWLFQSAFDCITIGAFEDNSSNNLNDDSTTNDNPRKGSSSNSANTTTSRSSPSSGQYKSSSASEHHKVAGWNAMFG